MAGSGWLGPLLAGAAAIVAPHARAEVHRLHCVEALGTSLDLVAVGGDRAAAEAALHGALAEIARLEPILSGWREDSELSRFNRSERAVVSPELYEVVAKAEAWRAAMLEENTPNETQRSIATHFHATGQDEVLAPYVSQYLEAAETAWENLGTHKAAVALAALFPRALASPELLDQVDSWLATTSANAGAQRLVREGRADVARYLAGQAKDALGG